MSISENTILPNISSDPRPAFAGLFFLYVKAHPPPPAHRFVLKKGCLVPKGVRFFAKLPEMGKNTLTTLGFCATIPVR